MPHRLRRWLHLWFAFDLPVDRRTYFVHGVSLFTLKYGVDVGLAWLALHAIWTPLDYLSPLWSSHVGHATAPVGLLVVQMLWTLPFLWIGVSLSMRRAIDAGLSPWWCLVFLLPFLNYGLMVILSLLHSVPEASQARSRLDISPEGRLRAALIGLATSLVAGATLVLLNIRLFHAYGASLFVLTPFVMGVLTAYLFNHEVRRSAAETLQVTMLALLLGAGGLVLFAVEGLVCVVMAFPIAATIALIGAMIGRQIALRAPRRPAHTALVLLLLPLAPATELHPTRPLREVCTVAIVDAPPEVVWRHVVAFSTLDEPPRWFFRLGIAYPQRATLSGSGVGAVRRCEFSTGAFVEPITAWEAPRRLAFDVASDPPAMTEWSPYAHLAPPHLTTAFHSRRGEFRLIALPSGRTRLEGRTWYALDLAPSAYWALWSDAIVHAIHTRVLAHVTRLAEMEAKSPRGR